MTAEHAGGPRALLSPAAMAVVRADAPRTDRLAAARGESHLPPAERLAALAVLAADQDPEVRETARERLSRGPVGPLLEGLGPSTDPRLLDILARARGGDSDVADALLRHPAVPDSALARLATLAPGRLTTAVQDRTIPRSHRARIAAAIGAGARAAGTDGGGPSRPSTATPSARPGSEGEPGSPPSGAAPEPGPLLPRGGEALGPRGSRSRAEEPGDRPARDVELSGEGLAEAAGRLADAHHVEFAPILTEETGEELPEGSTAHQSLYRQILGMSVSQKIQLAFKGNKEARGILIRDANKQVCGSVVRSPRVTETEVIAYASSRNVPDEVFRVIAANKDFTKLYAVRHALAGNPRVPLAIAVRCLNSLNDADIAALAKNRNVSSAISSAARRLVAAKQEKQRQREQVGGGH